MSLQEKAPVPFSPVPRIRAKAGTHGSRDIQQSMAGFVRDALVTIEAWRETARQRRALGRLDDRMLKDIGVTREQVTRELGRPFWDVW